MSKTYAHKGVTKKSTYIVVMTRKEEHMRAIDAQWVGHGKHGWFFCQLDQDRAGSTDAASLAEYASELRRKLYGASIDVVSFRNTTYLSDEEAE